MKKQRENSAILLRELNKKSMKLLYPRDYVYCTYFLFPMRFFSKERRDKAYEILRNKGIDSAKYWGTYPVAKLTYGYDGSCPNTEQVAQTIITIPNYYTLTNEELSKIIEICRSLT